MGTYTLENFRAELRFDLRNRPDTASSGVSDTRLDLWINAAYQHVAHPTFHRHREVLYTFTIPLVAGTNQYTWGTVSGVTMVGLRSVSHVDATVFSNTAVRTKLRARDAQWFDNRTLATGSRPSSYAIEGNTFLIDPVPSAVEAGELLFVRAVREPATLTAGTTTILANRWDEVILLGARWRAELHLGYRDLAEATKLDFAALANEYDGWDRESGEDWDYVSDLRREPTMERA